MNTLVMNGSDSGTLSSVRASAEAASTAFADQLERLYGLAQASTHVFASPLGPIAGRQGQSFVPRFVYFGPQSNDVSVRLAFYAGLAAEERCTSFALLHFVEEIATAPSLGEQLSLSFFPLVDSTAASARGISAENWSSPTHAEVDLLALDARQRRYHGFIRLETTLEDLLAVRLRTQRAVRNPAPAVELITDHDVAPYGVRWELASGPEIGDGPLSLGDAIGEEPFELTFRLPRHWSLEQHKGAVVTILSRFVQRYRAFVAYGQHL